MTATFDSRQWFSGFRLGLGSTADEFGESGGSGGSDFVLDASDRI